MDFVKEAGSKLAALKALRSNVLAAATALLDEVGRFDAAAKALSEMSLPGVGSTEMPSAITSSGILVALGARPPVDKPEAAVARADHEISKALAHFELELDLALEKAQAAAQASA